MTGFEDTGSAQSSETTDTGYGGQEAVHAFPATAARPAPAPARPGIGAPDVVSLPLTRAYRALALRITEAFSQGLDGVPARVSVALEGVDPVAWLAAQTSAPSFYWRDRDGARRVAGLGAADKLVAEAPDGMAALVDQAGRRLRKAPGGLRYYGGFRFDMGAPIGKPWREFGLGWLILPRFEVIEQQGATRLACTIIPGRDKPAAVLRALEALSPCPRLPAPPGIARRNGDWPDATGWAEAVSAVTRGIAEGAGWRKVVLARRTGLRLCEAPEALGILAALAGQTPRCFHFYFNPDGHRAFIGATPEQLFHRDGRTVHSEALAGTRPRGADGSEDARLEAELRGSMKDGREHGFVDSYVRGTLDRLTKGVESEGAVSVLKLASVQHLVRRMRGVLRRGCGDAALLTALHPTPAVCGEPPAESVAQITACEPFDRGWYAGPVGFVGRDETRMAVGIRSALVEGDTVWLYAGAGVVQGSQPQAEWRELEAKLRGIWPGQIT